ncbi:hypothetical protein LOTGIDRAFT_229862 [Lottia gigantea]|uniref:Large ribosomal subunit protein eL14 n=1 Tax=Lottia gigantea TaxID=225164 RepID=V3ZPT6_LOTGI|nr:hypothetical protein LOTGIDRAFT_229862 [Lottia gigantea]ESO82876.1 hypothetical protein LOTGIDRAFT_229862 [Lottia gigantea]
MVKLDTYKLYDRVVEVGRVVFIAYGPDRGKLAVIVDIIDQNRALIDGPASGVVRKEIGYKAINLTRFKLPIQKGICTKALKKVWAREKMEEKWAGTAWAKKLDSRQKREAMSDFDRFKVLKAKQARTRLINEEFNKLKASADSSKTSKKSKKAKK